MGTAAKSHISKIETEQAKILRTITNDPWYVRNDEIRKDLGIPTVQEEIKKYAGRYRLRIFFFFLFIRIFSINSR